MPKRSINIEQKRDSRSEVRALFEARCAASGITSTEARTLGLVPLTPSEVQKLSDVYLPIPALQIPYKDPFSSRAPKHPPFYRLRYLRSPDDFRALTTKGSPRYVQPPNSGVRAYYPHVNGVDWPKIAADASVRVLITEGELKAAKATIEGFPTIGLGGVHSFRSAREGFLLLPDLERVAWSGRKVAIVYDSDYRDNPHVARAINELAETLFDRGAFPEMVMLPALGDSKTGLDDFLVAESAPMLQRLLDEASPLTIARPLWSLNERVAWVRSPGFVVDLRSGQKMTPALFKDAAFAAELAPERTVKPDGTISLKKTGAAAAWLKWPLRREVESITYAPGADRFVEIGGALRLNSWQGWGCTPSKGDPAPFLALVDHLFTGADPLDKEWFLRWCAFPLQYPGTKLFTSAVLFGVRHGTGKSLLGYTLGRIYGKNFTEISSSDLHGSFNEWAESKQFVLGDDVTAPNRRADSDVLKKLITQKEMRVNAKYVPSYVVPDRVNYLFTSNHPDAFFLEDDDRRYFVHEIGVGPKSEEFYVDYDLWLDGGGAAHVFRYLLDLDLGDFNPSAPARRTAAKERMTADVKSDLGSWVERLRLDPDTVLRAGGAPLTGDLFTNRALLALYDPGGGTGTTANGLGRELRRAGFLQACGGRPVRTAAGIDRYYIVRNSEQWRTAAAASVVRHVDQHRGNGKF